MANSTVADLPAASALTGTEVIYADDGDSDVKVTPAQIKTFALTSPVSVGANVIISTTDIKVRNVTANIFANSVLIQVANSTATANLQPTQLVIGSSTINSTVISTGTANLYINTTAVRVPNTGLVTNTGATGNGYTFLPGGILMQWGCILSNSSVGNITFPIAFPTAFYHLSITIANTTLALANAFFRVIAANTKTANVRSANVGNPGANVLWLAIGN